MDIETRVTNLENLVGSLVKMMNNQKFYTDADIAGCRQTEGNLGVKNEEQDGGIDENDSAICDVAELSDENSSALEELAEMIDDLETRVEALEGKGE